MTRSLVDVDDQRFRIAVPNGFAKDWLETRYRSLISQTLARIVGYSVQVEFVVGPAPADSSPVDGADGQATPRPRWAERPGGPRRATRVGGEGGATNLNPRYTFANFIVGSANRLGTPRACRSPSVPVMPTTRSSCTAGWASARPT